MASAHQLFTVGHSNRSPDEFVALLHQHRVQLVADVRSQPTSARFPYFSSDPLRARLRDEDVEYRFWGDELGARREEPECYEAGQAKYNLIAKTYAFQAGLDRIRETLEAQPVALLCAEKDPLTCHRMILVCRHLREECDIVHLIDAHSVEPQAEAEARLLDLLGLPPRDLFRNEQEMLSDAYDQQGDRIAYCLSTPANQLFDD
jgi:uncharacterized protein (DUF488 family)